MRISRQWLNEITPVRRTDAQVAETFTQLGFECEHIEAVGVGLESIITVKIMSIRRHPNADKLQLATVTDGVKLYEVVCGALNIAVGQIVPLARMGVTLPNGQKMERVKIRGVESCGMLCSEAELNLNDDHSGIMQIDPVIKPGLSLSLVLGMPDTVYDLNVGPNRPDCLSVLGLAREYAAKYNQKITSPKFTLKQAATSTTRSITAEVIAKSFCSQYTLRYISDITVSPSPWWLQKRLMAGGVRPINAVVDAANYIMLATGQPLHAFDADKVATLVGRKSVSVRTAKNGESIILLDGTKKTLTNEIAVIADSKKVIAVAGVMGGSDSAVTAQTKNIIIESAVFNPKVIRKSSQKLGIRTESSNRFEKGVDLAGTIPALDSVASLINDLSGGVVHKSIAIGAVMKPAKSMVKYNSGEVGRMLGINVAAATQTKILKKLGCQVKKNASQITVVVPTWRSDISELADIVEEIGRHIGYDKVQPKLLSGEVNPLADRSTISRNLPIKQRLVEMGFTEMYNYSFYGADSIDYSGMDVSKHYVLSNPMNPDQQFLRTSLVPLLMENVKRNQNQFEIIKIFEIGTTFQLKHDLPAEILRLAGVITSKRENIETTLRQIKGILEDLSGKEVRYTKGISDALNIFDGSGAVRVWPATSQHKLKIKQSVVSFEIELSDLTVRTTQRSYQPYSAFPAMQRDLSIIAPNNLQFSHLVKEINLINATTISENGPRGLIRSVNPTGDTYRNERIGNNKKNLTIRCVFQSDTRTLTSTEVDKLIQQIINRLTTTHGIALSGDVQSK